MAVRYFGLFDKTFVNNVPDRHTPEAARLLSQHLLNLRSDYGISEKWINLSQ